MRCRPRCGGPAQPGRIDSGRVAPVALDGDRAPQVARLNLPDAWALVVVATRRGVPNAAAIEQPEKAGDLAEPDLHFE